MENINNTASLVSSRPVPVTLTPMIKAAGDAPLYITMKMIKDLGMLPYCNGKYKRHYAIYECPYCGKHFKTSINLVRRKETKSCGCYKILFGKITHTKHGMSNTELYSHWTAMKQRCNNKKGQFFYAYGGRGVKICREWEDFMPFKDWSLANGYKDGLYIDRIDNNKDYSPENCRWVNSMVNGQNKRLIDKRNKSGYRGVCFRFNKWLAQIHCNGKQFHIGMYSSAEEAALAYNNFVINHKTQHPLNIMK